MAKAKERLSPTAEFVKYGYGQVEGNKLSARYNGKIFASLPCSESIKLVENGMFLKYDYAKRMVDLDGPGEWLLAFNEVKVYDNFETDADFAMKAENYSAIVYNATADTKYAHYMPGTGTNKAHERELVEVDNADMTVQDKDSTVINPYGMMARGAEGASYKVNGIVPRLFGTEIGDIMTTNTIKEAAAPKVGDILKVDESTGYLSKEGNSDMQWQVVQVYTMPDLQPGVKLIRVA